MSTVTALTIGNRSDDAQVDPYGAEPWIALRMSRDAYITIHVRDTWVTIRDAYQAFAKTERRIGKLAAKLNDPANRHIPWNDPNRIAAGLQLADLEAELPRAVDHFRYRLHCLAGMLHPDNGISPHERIHFAKAYCRGLRSDADIEMIDRIYRDRRQYVDGQGFWPELLTEYGATLPLGDQVQWDRLNEIDFGEMPAAANVDRAAVWREFKKDLNDADLVPF